MDELRLDGNAAAGTLGEIFSSEVTTEEYACGGCGRAGTLGGAVVYEARELGTVARCPSCDNALSGRSTTAGATWSTSGGRATLRLGSLVEGDLPVVSLNLCTLLPNTDRTLLAH